MDISKWPLGRIMQLPDHCFGRRFMVTVELVNAADETNWDISELGLPDVCVIWELELGAMGTFGQVGSVRLALGDQLPTTAAQMNGYEPLISGFGLQGAEPRVNRLIAGTTFAKRRLRMPVMAQGRRLVMEVMTAAGNVVGVKAGIVVSGVPKEVPDCLLSV